MAKGKGKGKGRKSTYRRRMMYRRRNALARKSGNYATIEETSSIPITAGLSYTVNESINAYARASQLAQAYQYYRITKIVFKFKPNYDTFLAPGAPGAQPTLPYLYWIYDRSDSLPVMGAPQFEAVGVKPIRLDDKTVSKTLRPSVIVQSSTLGVPSLGKISPWLPTNRDTTGATFTINPVDHYGAVFYIGKMNPTDVQVYDVDVVATIQFKAPLVPPNEGATQQKITTKQLRVDNPGYVGNNV